MRSSSAARKSGTVVEPLHERGDLADIVIARSAAQDGMAVCECPCLMIQKELTLPPFALMARRSGAGG